MELPENKAVLSQQMQDLLDRIDAAIVLLDRNFNIIFANSFFRRMLGLESNSNINFLSLLPERDKNRAVKMLSRALNGDSIGETMLSVRSSRGSERLISWQVERLDDCLASIVLTGQDVTENETLQRELMAAHDKLASVLDNSKYTILTIDMEQRIDYVNRRGIIATGYTEDELIGKKIGEVFHSLNVDGLAGVMSTISSGSSFGPVEVRLRTKDGTLIPYELIADPLSIQGTVVGAVITANDITQRKKREERIIFQAAMLDQVESAVVAESLDGKITYWNKAAEKLFGWKEVEVIGSDLISIIKPDSLAGTALPSIESLKLLGSWNGDIQLERRDGTKFPARVSVSEIMNDEGKRVAIAFVIVDLTERLHLEDQLKSFNERLAKLVEKRTKQLQVSQEKLVRAERLAAIGELAAQVGHDLRNPLTSINTAIYLLDEMSRNDRKTRKEAKLAIKTMKKSIEHANRIIEELLEYSRGTISETRVEYLKPIVQSAIERLKVPDKIIIENNLPKDAIADVDNSKMQRVFENLIKNSIEAMPNGGKITIEGGYDDDKVWVSVKDQGIGMKKEQLDNIFKPLYTTKPQGMGLGLAICKRIVEAHGGSISVSSRWGEGTTVKIELPAVKRSKAKNELLDVGLSSLG